MGEVSHTNPQTGTTFGAAFYRGPAVADGGEPGDTARADSQRADAPRAVEDEQMTDVEHTAPDGDGARQVWERGTERDESATADEDSSEPVDDEVADE